MSYTTSFISFLLFISCTSISVQAQTTNSCMHYKKRHVIYSETRGNVVIYTIDQNQPLQFKEISCVFNVEFLSQVYQVPQKMRVVVTSEDYRKSGVIQYSLPDKTFAVSSLSIPVDRDSEIGIFINYPDPLKRIKELLISKKFPDKKQLPAHKRSVYKNLSVRTNINSIKTLVEEN